MGMSAVRRRRAVLFVVVSLALLASWQGYRLFQIHQFNTALRADDLEGAAAYPLAGARLAQALLLESQGAFPDALKLYAEIGDSDHSDVRHKALYNSANAHLRRGLGYLDAGNLDMALPMIELAKSGYRGALGDAPWLWDARFNLTRAVLAVPETDLEEIEEDIMPERSQRSLVPIPSRRELP